MFEEIKIIFSDYRKTNSRLLSAMRSSSNNAPSFIYSWTRFIAGKLLSLTLLAAAAIVAIAATQFFTFLAINLFLTGQIIPALLTLVPIAFCVAAIVPIFNQLLRITGIAEHCRKLVQKGKDMEFFGRAEIPSRKTPAEKNALANETDNPQLQIRITPPLPTRWIDVSYLIAPSDFYALPEYIRYAANWLVKKSGLVKYAASLDSTFVRSEFRTDTEDNVIAATPTLRFKAEIDMSKATALRFAQITGVGYAKDLDDTRITVKGINAEIAAYVKNRFKPNDPEFNTYHKFLIAKPVNHLYLKWYHENILPFEQDFTAANNAFIEFKQEQIRLEERRKLPLSKFVAQEVAAARTLSGMAAIKQILAIPANYINTKYAELAPESQTYMQKLMEAKARAEQKYAAALATEVDNGKEEYKAKKDFIAAFEAEYAAYKAAQAPDANNEVATANKIREIPKLLLLNDTMGVHLERNVKVLSAEEANDQNAITMKIAEFDMSIQKLTSQTATLKQDLEQKEKAARELKRSVAQHQNPEYRKYASANDDIMHALEMSEEIAGDELLSKLHTENANINGIVYRMAGLNCDLESLQNLKRNELKKLEKYRSEHLNQMHDLEAVYKGIGIQLNAGLTYLSNEYSHIVKNEKIAKDILTEARECFNIDGIEADLTEFIKAVNDAVLKNQQASTEAEKAAAREQLATAQDKLNGIKVGLQMLYAALPAKLYELVLDRHAKFRSKARIDPQLSANLPIITAYQQQLKQDAEWKAMVQKQTNVALGAVDAVKAALGYIPYELASKMAQVVPGSDPHATTSPEPEDRKKQRKVYAPAGQ